MNTLILLSGGLDSGVLLSKTLIDKKTGSVKCLSFNYGSKHNELELKYSDKLCLYFGVEHFIFDISSVFSLFKSSLIKNGDSIPKGHYSDDSMKKTVVPFRNGILLSIATGLAESIGFDEVIYGAHAGDRLIYPDCRSEFVYWFAKSVSIGTYKNITIASPFNIKSKADIVKIGIDNDFPFELTYSCYEGKEKHCGNCGACSARKEAFLLNKIEDPADYVDN